MLVCWAYRGAPVPRRNPAYPVAILAQTTASSAFLAGFFFTPPVVALGAGLDFFPFVMTAGDGEFAGGGLNALICLSS